MFWVQCVSAGLTAATLGVLIWYAIETRRLRKAAAAQIDVSQNLLRAANDQAEGIAKPCLTIRGKLRDATKTLLNMDDAVGGVCVGDEGGHYVAVNIGNGIAMNVSYFSSSIEGIQITRGQR
jgi:hypothetical protein